MDIHRHEYEMIKIWLMANEERASDEDLERLNRWLDENADARNILFDLTRHQGWLSWHGATAPGAAAPALDSPRWQEEAVGANSDAPPSERKPVRWKRAHDLSSVPLRLREAGQDAWQNLNAARIPLISIQMAALAACIAFTTWVFVISSGDDPIVAQKSAYGQLQAEIVSATVCVWNETNGAIPTLGQHFVEGDSVQLLEGVAELRVSGGMSEATLQLEGPAALVLANRGASTLRYGKVTIQAASSAGSSFPVETSFGRVSVEPGAEIGISSFGDSAEIHVFEGTAELESPWLVSQEGEFVTQTIQPGQMLKLNQAGDASLQVSAGSSDRQLFTSSLTMESNFLSVGLPYVREIELAAPVAYWRFERTVDGRIPNEMGGGYDAVIKGDCRLIGPAGSQAIEVGGLPNAGSLRVDESWDEVFADNFALEFWMKPSHYHVGTVFSFVGDAPPNSRKNLHGVAVEVQAGWGHEATTCRVRFTHRAPLGYDGGSSLFSDRPYAPRRWQHVVANRSGTQLELYLDGELVQSRADKSETPTGLRLVIGQLYTDLFSRPFIGYLDEMAIYDRALSGTEVREHFDLVRSISPRTDSI